MTEVVGVQKLCELLNEEAKQVLPFEPRGVEITEVEVVPGTIGLCLLRFRYNGWEVPVYVSRVDMDKRLGDLAWLRSVVADRCSAAMSTLLAASQSSGGA